MRTTSLSVLGLPNSGKTTYLAALWDAVSGSNEAGSLALVRLPSDRDYLTGIRDQWLRCEPTQRTRQGIGIEQVELELKIGSSDGFILRVPDVAGESFAALWEERSWSTTLLDVSATAEALLVFVHAAEVVPSRLLLELGEHRPATLVTARDEEATPPRPWDPADAPTQVKLVDLIQSVCSARASRMKLPIAVVLSAWDATQAQGLTPAQYLAFELPFLDQFLDSNSERIPSRIFGISAQGGDVSDPDTAATLRAVEPPSQRVIVDEGGDVSHDVTVPIKWLLSLTGQ